MLFRSARTISDDLTPTPVDAAVYQRIEAAIADQVNYAVEVSPFEMSPEFLAQIRDAARYGGIEFLDLIIQASEALTTNKRNLPDPIDPSSI